MAITYGIGLEAPIDPASLTSLATALGQSFANTLGISLTNQYKQASVTLRVGSGSAAPDAVYQATSTFVGPGTSAPLPQNCAYLIHKRTGLAGRRNRGRLYLPGPGEDAVDAVGGISSANVAAVQTRATDWLASVNTLVGVTTMYILHQGPAGAPAPSPTAISQLQVDPRIATQRTRLRR